MHDVDEIARAKDNRMSTATKLKLTAGAFDRGASDKFSEVLLAGLMKEAAEIIEEGEKFRPAPDSKYIEAIKNYRFELIEALKIADDPFKAPELTVETADALLSAIWEMRLQYAAFSHRA